MDQGQYCYCRYWNQGDSSRMILTPTLIRMMMKDRWIIILLANRISIQHFYLVSADRFIVAGRTISQLVRHRIDTLVPFIITASVRWVGLALSCHLVGCHASSLAGTILWIGIGRLFARICRSTAIGILFGTLVCIITEFRDNMVWNFHSGILCTRNIIPECCGRR